GRATTMIHRRVPAQRVVLPRSSPSPAGLPSYRTPSPPATRSAMRGSCRPARSRSRALDGRRASDAASPMHRPRSSTRPSPWLAPAAIALSLAACGGRSAYPTTTSALALERVVLYRNGIGYFERAGEIEGDVLTIKVRKDQVDDLLKSLTVVERRSGRAVS